MNDPQLDQDPRPQLNRHLSFQLSKNLDENYSEEINILILGETGTGKSTTINALANYLKFSSFEEALSVSEFLNLIPSKFTLPDPKTGGSFVIEDAAHENEHQHEDGAAKTQSPWGYVFKFGDRIIRLIDTPGMGDPRGIETDKENFDKIMYYLRHHLTLHGIIVLVKSSETRINASFRYCLNELFTHLHRDACRNMAFCFTHSRNTFYEPGEGYHIVKAFLDQSELTNNLQLKPGVNCFFIDNEAYRFLVAKKHGYPFTEEKIRLFKESWDWSVAQTEIMMKGFFQLEPHYLENTILLNSAKKLMLNLEEPMVQLQKSINENLDNLKFKLKQAKFGNQNLKIQLYDVELEPLEHPQLVCTEEKCVKRIELDGVEKEVFKTRCHKKCKIEGVETNLIGHPRLKKCHKFNNGELCIKCGCSWRKHMHLMYRFRKLEVHVLYDKEKFEKDKPHLMIQRLIDEYKQEYTTIQQIMVKFAHILKENSNSLINNFIEPYLDLLIEGEERKLRERLNYPRKALNSLMDMKKAHVESLKNLQIAIENSTVKSVDIKDVNTLRSELCNLKRTGETFRKIIHTTMPPEFQHPETPISIFD